ncbi:MAG: NADAR family protein [Myxococcota bacterium]
MATRILFYRVGDDYGEFSNFSPHPVKIDELSWDTTEHYFQAMKFEDPDARDRIRAADGPSAAARLGRTLAGLRPDWETAKDGVMMTALRAKFGQHDRLRRMLLDTGDAQLVEHSRNDAYWADGGDGSGRNRLGELLMKLRVELRAAMG